MDVETPSWSTSDVEVDGNTDVDASTGFAEIESIRESIDVASRSDIFVLLSVSSSEASSTWASDIVLDSSVFAMTGLILR